ncbi:MAG: hypothetical protein KKF30_19165 [Proteobacteria bacterium]|nr:hypothetical protein [Pseudomonadota bacterium]MBU4319386.1 hypothetical protein [Pseudomonadota bacterium]
MKTIFLALIILIFLGSGFAYAGDYTSSAHGNSTEGVSGRLSDYGTGNCAHCHEQHASVGGTEPAPIDGTPDEYLLFQDYRDTTYNSFCTDQCHDGTAARGDNIAAQYAKSYHHPTTGVHTPGESTQSAFGVRHGYCIDCHNPHVAKKIDRTLGSNLVSGGPLLKVSGVSVTNSTAWTAPSYAFIAASTGITKEYQLCFKCHSTWTTQPSGQTNIAMQFNTLNPSAHPVEAGLTASSSLKLTTSQMLSPWNVLANMGVQTMYCSDCHGDDAAGTPPKGPHGSGSVGSVGGPKILKGRWPDNSSGHLWTLGDADATKANDFDTECLCLNCHPVYDTAWKNNAHSDGAHPSTTKCVKCHVGLPHGSNLGRLIADETKGSPYDYNDLAEVRSFTKASNPVWYSKDNCTNDPAGVAGCYSSSSPRYHD